MTKPTKTIRTVKCASCGSRFEYRLTAGRPRKFCDSCRRIRQTSSRGKAQSAQIAMANLLGRKLRSNEYVISWNGVHGDVSPANLELHTYSRPAGTKVLDIYRFAVDFIRLYKDEIQAHLEIERQLPAIKPPEKNEQKKPPISRRSVSRSKPRPKPKGKKTPAKRSQARRAAPRG